MLASTAAALILGLAVTLTASLPGHLVIGAYVLGVAICIGGGIAVVASILRRGYDRNVGSTVRALVVALPLAGGCAAAAGWTTAAAFSYRLTYAAIASVLASVLATVLAVFLIAAVFARLIAVRRRAVDGGL